MVKMQATTISIIFEEFIPEIIELLVDNPYLQWRMQYFGESGMYCVMLFECLHETDESQLFCHCLDASKIIGKYPITDSAEIIVQCGTRIAKTIELGRRREFKKRNITTDFHNRKGRNEYLKR